MPFPSRLCRLAATCLAVLATSSVLASETWVPTGYEVFKVTKALLRSQGVAYDSDMNRLAFSWQLGLELTSMDYRSLVSRPMAIPRSMYQEGMDHIGDIDYFDGRFYVPLEDGDEYLRPMVATFDADTLTYTGESWLLPYSLQTEGVPWVAVDPARSCLYTAEWNPTLAINVFALDDLSFLRQIPLDQTLGRIQGAKVYRGALYAATDDETMSVYRIDLTSGHVETLFSLYDAPDAIKEDPMLEAEGLAFYDAPDGSSMHVILIRGLYPDPANPDRPVEATPSASLVHYKLASTARAQAGHTRR